MGYEIAVETVSSIALAATHANIRQGEIAAAWKPALDTVWTFLPSNQVPNTGQNVFLYRHPENATDVTDVYFGVQVKHPFDGTGDVLCIPTPAGEVAKTVHTGSYGDLPKAHAAIHCWCQSNQRRLGQASWEVYGHWDSDQSKLQTTIYYLLA